MTSCGTVKILWQLVEKLGIAIRPNSGYFSQRVENLKTVNKV